MWSTGKLNDLACGSSTVGSGGDFLWGCCEAPASPVNTCPSGFTGQDASGMCYKALTVSGGYSWDAANTACRGLNGGHSWLASMIDSATATSVVPNMCGGLLVGTSFWTGLRDKYGPIAGHTDPAGSYWHWMSGGFVSTFMPGSGANYLWNTGTCPPRGTQQAPAAEFDRRLAARLRLCRVGVVPVSRTQRFAAVLAQHRTPLTRKAHASTFAPPHTFAACCRPLAAGEPNDVNGIENCGQVAQTVKKLNDLPCGNLVTDTALGACCQAPAYFVPSPSPTASVTASQTLTASGTGTQTGSQTGSLTASQTGSSSRVSAFGLAQQAVCGRRRLGLAASLRSREGHRIPRCDRWARHERMQRR